MWHWNFSKSGKILSRYINTGKEIAYINENNTLSISISENVSAMDLNFLYPQDKITIDQFDEKASEKEIVLSHLDTLSGEYLIVALPIFYNQSYHPTVSFTLDRLGAQKFGRTTTDNVGKRLAIILDGKIISAPSINEPIISGSGIISGNFTFQEARDLAIVLR